MTERDFDLTTKMLKFNPDATPDEYNGWVCTGADVPDSCVDYTTIIVDYHKYTNDIRLNQLIEIHTQTQFRIWGGVPFNEDDFDSDTLWIKHP